MAEFGFSSSTETRSFAEELFSRVPRKQSGLSVSSYLINWVANLASFWDYIANSSLCLMTHIFTLFSQLYQKQEREAAILARKQKQYAILDADDDDDDNSGGGDRTVFDKSVIAAASEPKRADTHKKRFRKKTDSEENEDNEVNYLYPC